MLAFLHYLLMMSATAASITNICFCKGSMSAAKTKSSSKSMKYKSQNFKFNVKI